MCSTTLIFNKPHFTVTGIQSITQQIDCCGWSLGWDTFPLWKAGCPGCSRPRFACDVAQTSPGVGWGLVRTGLVPQALWTGAVICTFPLGAPLREERPAAPTSAPYRPRASRSVSCTESALFRMHL